MILTKRDKEILKFVEENQSLTINQCAKIFFTKNKQAYYQARKRLKLLSNNGYINRFRKDMRSEAIYYQNKKLSIHDLKILDVYAELIFLGVEIKLFKREYTIDIDDKKSYRVDAVIEVAFNGYFFPLIVEIDYTHFTSNKKLQDIYNSNHFQKKYKAYDEDMFPAVVIVRLVLLDNQNLQSESFDLYHLDFTISNLKQVFA